MNRKFHIKLRYLRGLNELNMAKDITRVTLALDDVE